MIDCQQNTRHLASLGAREVAREEFVQHVAASARAHTAPWQFEPVYWNAILPHPITA
jgi:leucyl/phenylalanyl-tRNA--protein transferase